jgi:hypothetical protein
MTGRIYISMNKWCRVCFVGVSKFFYGLVAKYKLDIGHCIERLRARRRSSSSHLRQYSRSLLAGNSVSVRSLPETFLSFVHGSCYPDHVSRKWNLNKLSRLQF